MFPWVHILFSGSSEQYPMHSGKRSGSFLVLRQTVSAALKSFCRVSLIPAKQEWMGARPSRIIPVALVLAMLTGCAALPEQGSRTPSLSYQDTADTSLGEMVRSLGSTSPDQSGFVLLNDGLDAFVARAVLADAAQRKIDMQYYLYHPDLVGRLLAAKLLEAADRGVRVRVLLDDIATEGRDLNFAVLDSHPNIEIRLFNPFSRSGFRALQFVTRFGEVTRRMHNKSFTVDNQATIIGGRNIGNEYFEADPDKNFGDLDVLAIGPVVREVSESFDLYWNNELAYPISTLYTETMARGILEEARNFFTTFSEEQEQSSYVQALRDSTLANNMRNNTVEYVWGKAAAIYDRPEKISEADSSPDFLLAPQLGKYVNDMQSEMIILSAYFVPGWEGVRFLQELSRQGIEIKILTNSLASTDVAAVHAGYAKYRRDLLRAGVQLYELKKSAERSKNKGKLVGSSGASLHAKSFIFDRKLLFIGSFNFDPRSYEQNTEIGLIFNSPQLAGKIGEYFDDTILDNAYKLEMVTTGDGNEILKWLEQDGDRQVVHYREPDASLWRRIFVGLASIIPIEGQL